MMRTKGLHHPLMQNIGGGRLAVAPRANAYPPLGSPELLTNGDFSSGTTGWTGQNASLAESGGVLTVTNTGTNGLGYQAFTTTIGLEYTVSVAYLNGGAGTGRVKIGTTAGGNETHDSGILNTLQNVLFSFTATATTHYISLQSNGAAGQDTDWDSASVRVSV